MQYHKHKKQKEKEKKKDSDKQQWSNLEAAKRYITKIYDVFLGFTAQNSLYFYLNLSCVVL